MKRGKEKRVRGMDVGKGNEGKRAKGRATKATARRLAFQASSTHKWL